MRLSRPDLPADLLAITIEWDGATCHMRLAGEFDRTGVKQVERALEEIDPDGLECLIFDLEEIDFLDLAALRAILRAHERARRSGFSLNVIRPRGMAGRIFTLTSLGRELQLVDAVDR